MTHILIKKYPELFSEYCDISIREGWIPIVNDLCDKIVKTGKPVIVQQIKEKFGGLRFYTNSFDSEIDELINESKRLAYQTCEFCGKPGTQTNTSWIKTLCIEHLRIEREKIKTICYLKNERINKQSGID